MLSGRCARSQRLHNKLTDTGELAGANPLSGSSLAILTYTGLVYDQGGRVRFRAEFGSDASSTSGTVDLVNGMIPGECAVSPKDTLPSANCSPAVVSLLTRTDYDSRGLVSKRTDPKGILAAYTYDALDREVALIENATGNVTVAWNSGTSKWWPTFPTTVQVDEDRTTTFKYDGIGNVILRTAHTPANAGTQLGLVGYQSTEYVYGVATGSSPHKGGAASDHYGRRHAHNSPER